MMSKSMSISVNGQSQVPPGFRFHPTEEELLQYYLRKKVNSIEIDLDVIREVDLNKLEPWDIQGSLQKKDSIGSYELLSKTAPIHAISLLMRSFELLSKMIIFGPFLHYFFSGRSIATCKMHLMVPYDLWCPQDLYSKVWWLGVGFDDIRIRLVGYRLVEIFTRLINYAEYVQWSEEIKNRNISSRHTLQHIWDLDIFQTPRS